jgi:transcriptional repressor NrdR
MKCPYCGSDNTKVVDKRDNREDSSTRRRRQCLRCCKRFTTYERIEKIDVSIVKKDGSLEKFDAQKVKKGIDKSVDHHKISDEEIDKFLIVLERFVLNSEDPVKSIDVGKMVLDWLKTRDSLAYIRFASVYKNFESVNDFEEEIQMLKNNLN